jgi:hypothetical protein
MLLFQNKRNMESDDHAELKSLSATASKHPRAKGFKINFHHCIALLPKNQAIDGINDCTI